jgi:hypothetical protein
LSTPIAVTTALCAALLFGISSVADQRSTKRVKTEKTLSPSILVDLVRQPLWLIAIATNIAGFALQVVALSAGSLAVVQPLLVFDLVFAVLIVRSYRWDASTLPPGTKRWDPVLLAGVGAATLGVAGFLAIGQPSAGHADVGFAVLVPLAIGLVVVVGGCLVVAARRPNLRPLAIALACGVNYGVAAFAVKLVTSEFGSGPARVFTNWPIYVLAVAGPASSSTRTPSSRARSWRRSKPSSPPLTLSSPSGSAFCGSTRACAAPPRRSPARSWRYCS